jgi:hypothetical protein
VYRKKTYSEEFLTESDLIKGILLDKERERERKIKKDLLLFLYVFSLL